MSKKKIKSPYPRVNKTKEQLINETEVARKRKIVIEKFYPALVEATISIDEAKMLIQATNNFIMEEVLSTMKERKFSEISARVLKRLCPDGVRQPEIEKLLAFLEKETLFVARELFEGMTRAIDHTVNVELRGRKLDTLKPDWNIMLN